MTGSNVRYSELKRQERSRFKLQKGHKLGP